MAKKFIELEKHLLAKELSTSDSSGSPLNTAPGEPRRYFYYLVLASLFDYLNIYRFVGAVSDSSCNVVF